MTEGATRLFGGCLCGALRYVAQGAPLAMGHCYCADCRKASGSGFIPFMNFSREAVRFDGPSVAYVSQAAGGGEATRNFCPLCGGLVFGGERGISEGFTLYAGSLDDPAAFRPAIAIFNRDRPSWAPIPPGLTVFETMPS